MSAKSHKGLVLVGLGVAALYLFSKMHGAAGAAGAGAVGDYGTGYWGTPLDSIPIDYMGNGYEGTPTNEGGASPWNTDAAYAV